MAYNKVELPDDPDERYSLTEFGPDVDAEDRPTVGQEALYDKLAKVWAEKQEAYGKKGKDAFSFQTAPGRVNIISVRGLYSVKPDILPQNGTTYLSALKQEAVRIPRVGDNPPEFCFHRDTMMVAFVDSANAKRVRMFACSTYPSMFKPDQRANWGVLEDGLYLYQFGYIGDGERLRLDDASVPARLAQGWPTGACYRCLTPLVGVDCHVNPSWATESTSYSIAKTAESNAITCAGIFIHYGGNVEYGGFSEGCQCIPNWTRYRELIRLIESDPTIKANSGYCEPRRGTTANELVPHPGVTPDRCVGYLVIRAKDLKPDRLCTFPLDIKSLSDCPLPSLFVHESRPPNAGGFYPLGLFGTLHGGVHFPTKGSASTAGLVPVRAIAPGRIVAARLHEGVPKEARTEEPDLKEIKKRRALVVEAAGHSNNFVLIRHEIELKVNDKPPEPVVFYCLYMHLADPGWDADGLAAQAAVKWLSSLIRQRLGAWILVDPDATVTVDGTAQGDGKGSKAAIGQHLWAASDKAFGTLKSGNLSAYLGVDGLRSSTVSVAGHADNRIVLVGTPAATDVAKAIVALTKGDVITFPEAHPSLRVDHGTIIGHTPEDTLEDSDVPHGFIHWELLSPAVDDKGLCRLWTFAEEKLGVKLDAFSESTFDNSLDEQEEKEIEGKLPSDADRATAHDLSKQSFAQPASGQGDLGPGHYHMRLTFKNYKKLTLPSATQKIHIEFKGVGLEDGKTVERSEKRDLEIAMQSESVDQTLDVPGWASSMVIAAEGLMVRQTPVSPKPDHVSAHVKNIAASRWRGLRVRRMNEWSKDITKVLEKLRINDAASKALPFWGVGEVPAYSSKTLFGTEVPADTHIDNVHPILAEMILNMLIERGLASFVVPAATPEGAAESKALFAGWLPAVVSREPQSVGVPMGAVAIRDSAHGVCEAKLEAVAGALRVPLRLSPYDGDTLALQASFSAWGAFKIEVSHGGKVQSPESLGDPVFQLLPPKLSKATPDHPTIDPKTGHGSWLILFEDNCPIQLAGYVVAMARKAASSGASSEATSGAGSTARAPADPALVKVALPMVAKRPEVDPKKPYFKGQYLVRGPEAPATDVAKGITWKELVDAAGKPPERVATVLLNELATLRAQFAPREFELVAGSLTADGCSISVCAKARGKGAALRTGQQNNVDLLAKAKALVSDNGLATAAPDPPDAGADPGPDRVSLAVTEPPVTAGALDVEFDSRRLLGAAVKHAVKELSFSAKDDVEVFLGFRFYNGGHLVAPGVRGKPADPTPDAKDGIIEDVDWDAEDLKGRECLEVFSRTPHAAVSLPRFGTVVQEYYKGGMVVTVPLKGGDKAFWTAAEPRITVAGANDVYGQGNGTTVSGTVDFCFPKSALLGKTFTVEIANAKTAVYQGMEFGPGDIKTSLEPYNAKPDFSDIKVTKEDPSASPKGTVSLLVTANVRGLTEPYGIEAWMTAPSGKEVDFAWTTPITKAWYKPDNAEGYWYLTPGHDGIAKLRFTINLAQLMTTYPDGAAFQVFVGERRWSHLLGQGSATWNWEPPPKGTK